jgi:uncharacterized membrane protein
MKKIGTKGMAWLKAFHAFFACIWVGSSVVLCVKLFFISAADGGELYGIMSTLDFIDIKILVPGATGIVITGIIYSVWTNRGWFKHRWIIVKWIICIYGTIFGTYPLGPWMKSLADISKAKGIEALADPVFLHNQKMLYIFGTFQCLTLIFAVFVTAIKPWRKKNT